MLVSCGESIDDMIDDYNGGIAVEGAASGESTAPTVVPCPGDEDFDERNMLYPDYGVSNKGLLELGAPNNCSSYSWVFRTVDASGEVVPFITYGETTKRNEWTGRLLNIYVPSSALQDGMYRLTLKVTGEDGKPYTDSTVVSIYPDARDPELSYNPSIGGF